MEGAMPRVIAIGKEACVRSELVRSDNVFFERLVNVTADCFAPARAREQVSVALMENEIKRVLIGFHQKNGGVVFGVMIQRTDDDRLPDEKLFLSPLSWMEFPDAAPLIDGKPLHEHFSLLARELGFPPLELRRLINNSLLCPEDESTLH
jgi:hypothetical protein